MSIQPLITFKAGQCELTAKNGTQQTVKPIRTPGYVYLYQGEDEFVHFCWRPREASLEESELDLIMIPGDGAFQPYTGKDSVEDSENVQSPTDGRIFVLKFTSSSQRYLFWLQSKSQHPRGDASWFSERDQKVGQIVDLLLSGEEIDVQGELASVQNPASGGDDDDEMMEDADDSTSRDRSSSTGGAGAGATGGDIREEGAGSREGGADGGRAAADTDVSSIVQNFMNSLKGSGGSGSGGDSGSSQSRGEFATLLDLLWPTHTLPTIEKAPDSIIDALCAQLPTTPFLIEAEVEDIDQIDPNSETAQMAMQTLDQDQKREVLKNILRAPQLRAALGSLTEALQTGALPTVSQGLQIDVANGGYMRGGGMPLGGGEAIKAFLEGVKKTAEKEKKGDDEMDMS